MGVQFSEVIERMKRAANLKNDSRVARTLGVTPQAISNYKKRGAIPADLILRFADLYGLSVDWLVTGEGEPYRPGYEGKVIPPMSAAEGMAPYGGYGKGLKGLADFAALAPEEILTGNDRHEVWVCGTPCLCVPVRSLGRLRLLRGAGRGRPLRREPQAGGKRPAARRWGWSVRRRC